METFDFDSKIGKPVEFNLVFDGEQRGVVQIYRMIPYAARAAMIQSVIDCVIFDGSYHSYNYDFSLNYQLIRYYTDIVFPENDVERLEEETDDEYERRRQNIVFSNAQEFMYRSNIMQLIFANVFGVETIKAEIDAGIEYAKQRQVNSTPWDYIGMQLSGVIDSLKEIAAEPGMLEALSGVIKEQTPEQTEEKEE